jgi:hypothetical protein
MAQPSYFARLAPAARSPDALPRLIPPRAVFREAPTPAGFISPPEIARIAPVTEPPGRPAGAVVADDTAPGPFDRRFAIADPSERAAPRRPAAATGSAPNVHPRPQAMPTAAHLEPSPAAAAARAPAPAAARPTVVDTEPPPPGSRQAAGASRPRDVTASVAETPSLAPEDPIDRAPSAARRRAAVGATGSAGAQSAKLWIGALEVRVTPAASPRQPPVRQTPAPHRAAPERITRPFAGFGLRQS